ncbi:MAG: aromatic-ring-hydroxylating dioxygenase subunit beta [Sulfolobaceae archaeon]
MNSELKEEVELYFKILNFVYKEVELLNEEDYEKWLELLDDNFEYFVIVGEITQNKKLNFSKEKFLFSADKNKWRLYIQRLKSEYGWAYNYAKTFTRRIIGNVRIIERRGSEIHVNSSFILLRIEGDEMIKGTFNLISGKREDVIRIYSGGNEMKLYKRIIYLDTPNYPSYNLYFPI